MAHLLPARKAKQRSRTGLDEAELALDGEGGLVEVENPRAQHVEIGGLEEPVERCLDRLAHQPAVPERLRQPVADLRALAVGVKADVPDQPFARELDGEARVFGWPVGPPRPEPGFGVGKPVGIRHAREIPRDGEVVEKSGQSFCIGDPRLPQDKAPGRQTNVHLGCSSSSTMMVRSLNLPSVSLRLPTCLKPIFSRIWSEAALSLSVWDRITGNSRV